MKKKLLVLLQLLVAAALITWLFIHMRARGDLSKFGEVLGAASQNWPLLAAGFMGFFACIVACSWRWQILLAVQGLHLRLWRIVELYFIGHFFSTFLPGATGGDLVKAYFAAREMPSKKTAAVSTVFIDRIVGLLAHIVLAIAVMAARFRLFMAHQELRVALVFTSILGAVSVVGLFVLFQHNLFERWALFRRFEERTAAGRVAATAYRAFHASMTHPSALAKTLVLSAVNHIMLIVCVALAGRGIGIDIPFIDFVTAFMIINAVASIPITPGGLGTRETASIYILGVFGVSAPQAFSLSILLYATMLIWGVVGGLVYAGYALRQRGAAPAPLDPGPSNP